jgi:hypothetical protein
LGQTLTGSALVVEGGDFRTDISASGVGIATSKRLTRGTVDYGTGETIGTFNMYGVNTAGVNAQYASIRGVCTNPTAGGEKGRLNLTVLSGVIPNTIAQVDAAENEFSIQGNSLTTLNMTTKTIKNAKIIRTQDISNASAGLIISAPYQLSLADPCLTIEGGDFRTDTIDNGVHLNIQKNIRSGTTSENIGQINFFGLDSSASQRQMGLMNCAANDSTAGAVDSRINFSVRNNSVLTRLLVLDGSNNVVSVEDHRLTNLSTPTDASDATTKAYVDAATSGVTRTLAQVLTAGNSAGATAIDMSGNAIQKVRTISAQPVVSQGIIISTTHQLSPGDPALTIEGGSSRADISNSGVNLSLTKNIRSGTTSENIGQINFNGLTSAPGVYQQYGYINCSAEDSTVGTTDAKITFTVRRNGVLGDYLVVDGSNNIVSVEDHRLTKLSTPTDASDATTKAYVDAATSGVTRTLAQVLTAGNSAGANAINMNGNNITSVAQVTNIGSNLDITADDVNINAQGITSVLNINSVLATVIASVGAIDITAGGTTAINSTGNVTIGSLGTTSIENFNLNNSVMSKVSATADLELNNIATINNAANGVSMVGATTIRSRDISGANAGVDILAPFQLGLTDPCFTVEGGDNRTDISNSGVSVNIQKKIRSGTTSESIGQMNFYGLDSAAVQRQMGIVGVTAQNSTAGSANTSMGLSVLNANASKRYINIDGSNNIVSITSDTSITTTGANPTALLIQNDDNGPSAAIVQIFKNSASPAVNDVVGNLQFVGNTTTGVKHTYANIQGAIQDTTNGAEDGEMRLRATMNGTPTDFIHLDASNQLINMNPSGAAINFTVEDISGRNLIYTDATAQNVMFRNYPQQYIYDISGTYTITLPNGFNTMRILAYGAGGGGGSGRFSFPGAAGSYGGGAGGGGAGGESWFSRKELFGDASDNMSLFVTVGAGGTAGAAQTVQGTDGVTGGNGGSSSIRLTNSSGYSLFATVNGGLQGGFGGSGGTLTTGNGGNGGAWQMGNWGTSGVAGGASKITGNADNSNPTMVFYGTLYMNSGGSGGGGGIAATGATAYSGAFVSFPTVSKWYSRLVTQSVQGSGGNTAAAGNGSVVTWTAGGITTTNPAIQYPLVGSADRCGGGGACIFAGSPGGNGGSIGAAGVSGSRGGGGGGGGASIQVASGAGGRGSDGFVYITIW